MILVSLTSFSEKMLIFSTWFYVQLDEKILKGLKPLLHSQSTVLKANIDKTVECKLIHNMKEMKLKLELGNVGILAICQATKVTNLIFLSFWHRNA